MTTIKIKGMSCNHCVMAVTKALNEIEGIKNVKVDLAKGEADLDVGLLLLCNVIVYETDNKKSYVSVVNPVSALGIIESEKLRKIAEEVSEKLRKVIEKL